MTDDRYNGWTNRETWAFQLHLSNDQGLYEMVTDWATDALDQAARDAAAAGERYAENPATIRARWALAEQLKDWAQEMAEDVFDEDVSTSPEIRLMIQTVGSFWRIDFDEVARAWIDAAVESRDAS